MTTFTHEHSGVPNPQHRFAPVLMALLIAAVAVAIAFATLYQPVLGIILALLVALGLSVLIQPDIATLAVAFILYTNAATVAVKFHNAPSFVSAAFLGLLLIPLGYYLVLKRQPIIITRLMPLLVAYLLIQLAGALLSARDVTLAIPSLVTFATEGVLLYLLITNVVRTTTLLRGIVWVLLIAGLFMGALSLYQQVTHTLDNPYGGFAQNDEQTEIDFSLSVEDQAQLVRQAGPIGEKNRYSQILLMLVPLGMFRFWGERTKRLQLLAAVCTIFCLVGSVLTFSRGGAVGLGLTFLVMVAMRYIKLRQLVLVGLTITLLLVLFPRYTERLVSLQSLTAIIDPDTTAGIKHTDGAIQGRATEMLAAAYVFADHPLLGVGPGMFPQYVEEYARRVGIRTLTSNREAHVLYLGIAADSGILGLTCFLAILAITLRDLLRASRRLAQRNPDLANLCAGFMFSLVMYMTTGLFLHMSYARYFWFVLALANMASYLAERTPSSQDDPAPALVAPHLPNAPITHGDFAEENV